MMKTQIKILLLLTMPILSFAQLEHPNNERLEQNMRLFNQFKTFVVNAIKNKEDIGDSTHLRNAIENYFFVNKKIQTGEARNQFSNEDWQSVRNELNAFYTLVRKQWANNNSEDLTIRPISVGSDNFIYEKLTDFQKENTWVLFDKNSPNKIFNYILFLPPTKNVTDKPKIWSWTLEFEFGKYMFRSLIGEEGYEYIFSPQK